MAENIEQKYYNTVFTKTDISGLGKIEGKQAVMLFRTSGVSVQTLKQIWDLATPNKEDFLDKKRFFVALKLIALAQEGKPVAIQLLHEKTGLPRFDGIDLPQQSDEWEIGENEMNVYINGFKKLSGDKGFLTLNESKELLQRTQFTPPVLKRIWTLIQLDTVNSMGQDQFVVAMQLITKIRSGVECPEILPGSLDRIMNKKKIESPKPEPVKIPELSKPQANKEVERLDTPRLRDPEAHVEMPKPISKSTLGDNYEGSQKMSPSKSPKFDIDKHFKEKERLLKEKTNILKSICEMLDIDMSELELIKEKNKMLEGKIKESQENYEKVLKKVNKSKGKIVKIIEDVQSEVKAAKKEKKKLEKKVEELSKVQKNVIDAPPAAQVTISPAVSNVQVSGPVSSVQVTEMKVKIQEQENPPMPKKDLDFEFDNFFKDPIKTSDPEQKKPPTVSPIGDVWQNPISPTVDLQKDNKKRQNFEANIETSEKKEPEPMLFNSMFPDLNKKEPEKAAFSMNQGFFNPPANFGAFTIPGMQTSNLPAMQTPNISMPIDKEPKKVEVPEPKPQVKKFEAPEIKPVMTLDFKPSSRSDDIFADLDTQIIVQKPSIEVKPPVVETKQKIHKKKSSSSSDSDKKPESKDFGFKFNDDLEKKIEKPAAFEFKPDAMNFNAGFGDFNKGFMFPAQVPGFSNDFFKIDTQAIQNKSKPRDIEFE
ncbi:hypothetical protein SteCoe_730 [Stentor coeruleus]|uniref:EH domain-containing protein n=1 Tax=Stentor coeruleus TaxID=5963 RepID=A0A1R2D3N1_9CILI|nr:hypothetical protein SteCoe_730 [Stentor coeruleus]